MSLTDPKLLEAVEALSYCRCLALLPTGDLRIAERTRKALDIICGDAAAPPKPTPGGERGWRSRVVGSDSPCYPGCFQLKLGEWYFNWWEGKESFWDKGPGLNYRKSSRDDVLAALSLADPPPTCMEPDACAERDGIADAIEGTPDRFCYRNALHLDAYRRAFDRQRAKMKGTPCSPPSSSSPSPPSSDSSAGGCPSGESSGHPRSKEPAPCVSGPPSSDAGAGASSASSKASSSSSTGSPTEPASPPSGSTMNSAAAADRDAVVERAIEHLLQEPTTAFSATPERARILADFALAEVARETAELRADVDRWQKENAALLQDIEKLSNAADGLADELSKVKAELATANREREEVEKVLEAERAECRRRNELIIEARAERDAARSSFEGRRVISRFEHGDPPREIQCGPGETVLVLAPPSAPKAEGLHWAERTNEERTRIIDDILARVAKLEAAVAHHRTYGVFP